MNRLLSNPRFLAVYSGILTVVFLLTVFLGFYRGVFTRRAEFDQITVHRIDIVEPNGTPRLIISDKDEFPGSLYHGKNIPRPDRTDSAGMLFMNDEGTENGGLIFGGYQGKDGIPHSWGHLSFDEYEQDQTLAMDSEQDGRDRTVHYRIRDNGAGLLTPDAMDAIEKARRLPTDTPQDRIVRRQALEAAVSKYQIRGYQRVDLGKDADKSVALRLKDASGHDRIVLRVAPDGTPSIEFFDASGRVTHHWPEK